MDHMPALMLGLVGAASSVGLTSKGHPELGIPVGLIGLLFVTMGVAFTWINDRNAKARVAVTDQHVV